MKRIIHCNRHRQNYYHSNFLGRDKFRLKTSYPNLPRRKTKTNDTIYRSPQRLKTNIEIGKNKKNLLRISLPVFTPQ